jgi:hypothetical protein
MAVKHGKTDESTWGSIKTVDSMGMESSRALMAASTKATGSKADHTIWVFEQVLGDEMSFMNNIYA